VNGLIAQGRQGFIYQVNQSGETRIMNAMEIKQWKVCFWDAIIGFDFEKFREAYGKDYR